MVDWLRDVKNGLALWIILAIGVVADEIDSIKKNHRS